MGVPTIDNLINIHKAEPTVIELDGFLNAVRCVLDCPRRLFLARFLECTIEDDLEHLKTLGSLSKLSELSFNSVHEQFVKNIYEKISKEKTRALENLDWNLVEYFGLISTADEEDGPWNRLIDQNHASTIFIESDGCESLVFYVVFSSFVVAVHLGLDWS